MKLKKIRFEFDRVEFQFDLFYVVQNDHKG